MWEQSHCYIMCNWTHAYWGMLQNTQKACVQWEDNLDDLEFGNWWLRRSDGFSQRRKVKIFVLWVGDLHWQGFSSFWLVIPHFWWFWPKIKWGDIVLSNCAFEFWAYGWLARILSLCSMLVLMGTCSKNVFVQCTHLWWCKAAPAPDRPPSP